MSTEDLYHTPNFYTVGTARHWAVLKPGSVFVLGLKRPSVSSLLGQADLQGSPQVNDSYPTSLCIEPSVQRPLAFLTSDLQTAQAEVKGP